MSGGIINQICASGREAKAREFSGKAANISSDNITSSNKSWNYNINNCSEKHRSMQEPHASRIFRVVNALSHPQPTTRTPNLQPRLFLAPCKTEWPATGSGADTENGLKKSVGREMSTAYRTN